MPMTLFHGGGVWGGGIALKDDKVGDIERRRGRRDVRFSAMIYTHDIAMLARILYVDTEAIEPCIVMDQGSVQASGTGVKLLRT